MKYVQNVFVFETWCEHRFLKGGLWWRWRRVITEYSWSTDADDDADHQVAVDDSWELNAHSNWEPFNSNHPGVWMNSPSSANVQFSYPAAPEGYF